MQKAEGIENRSECTEDEILRKPFGKVALHQASQRTDGKRLYSHAELLAFRVREMVPHSQQIRVHIFEALVSSQIFLHPGYGFRILNYLEGNKIPGDLRTIGPRPRRVDYRFNASTFVDRNGILIATERTAAN
ncbi:unnamed protein product [Cuscuta europaea]|uniref:Uncharacterized protein n=1 Tax=Cuscuta europaea TaxID=41803 RepID=A0A9P0ZE46_CUSEU|nr:unnamed protein product [Cuscuta europaea]